MDSVPIIDRGRGPELARTRITVYDLLPYLRAGRSPTYIASWLGLSTAEVEALIRYIEDHEQEVQAVNARIEERIARGNPPEVEARLTRAREQLRALQQQLHHSQEANGAGNPG